MKDFFFNTIQRFRYERKFRVTGLSREEAESIIRMHPAIFREIYHERSVNSLYFDSYDLQHYSENVTGAARRLKVRIRWYGELLGLVKQPVLELKLKHNLHVGKLLYSVEPFVFDRSFSARDVFGLLKKSDIPDTLKIYLGQLYCSVLVRYDRKYFLSSDGDYRLTLDANILAYRLYSGGNIFMHSVQDGDTLIFELKYNHPGDESASAITNFFPFRMTRSSKYMDSISRLYV